MSKGHIEHASGKRTGAESIIANGLREVGRKLVEERAADARAGRPCRTLSMLGYRALMAAREDELQRL
jgi:hypothetical protein